ncbi:DUF2271 domain-containing protein [Marinobacter halodurans]|uniref:DUF2271 domain-containing protein n=1 Tax=Marinobacter halodurans TaxID=2528979 RepID=A0ABY1ZS36_9GAMM|nr:DUF2271 domain-containing protein [Marinobacter halodurans]TBW57723.1 DUF2271 domain-containing protein [Marinobacter halodurans]
MSAPASATEVTFTAKLNNYYGNDAYLALYLTDRNGQYQRTLWVAGRHAKYYRHLRQWARAGGQSRSEYDGRTGASVQSGHILKVTADLPDSLIDAGYDVRIDSAVEDFRESPSDVVTPLTRDGAGQPVAGRGFVDSFRYDFR